MIQRFPKAMVIYDGGCGLCAGNLKWLHRMDVLGKFEALPFQDSEVYRRYPQLDRLKCEQSMHLVLKDGGIYQGWDAFTEIFLRMPLLVLPGIVMKTPPFPWFGRKLYHWVASHRYELGGRCKVKVQPGRNQNSFLSIPFFFTAALVVFLLWVGCYWTPNQRLLSMTGSLLYSLKLAVLNRYRQNHPEKKGPYFSTLGLLIYLTIWPGMDPGPFRKRTGQDLKGKDILFQGVIRMGRGVAGIIILAYFAMEWSPDGVGWMGVGLLLLTIHLGCSDVLVGLLRCTGWDVRRLFNEPFQSRSLDDFWSRRWNVAFIEMDRILFLKPLVRLLGARAGLLGVFLISGVFHELAVSYPVQGQWGLPLVYFIIQGILVLIESSWLSFRNWPVLAQRIWTAFWIFIPLPLLFHHTFREQMIVPIFLKLNERIFP